jgi:hypothetical protein
MPKIPRNVKRIQATVPMAEDVAAVPFSSCVSYRALCYLTLFAARDPPAASPDLTIVSSAIDFSRQAPMRCNDFVQVISLQSGSGDLRDRPE